ncbi:hypothetical protein C8A05DRAFT_18781 [Staphylotrichum tortipilum]|uniref:RNA polymerase II subunit A C-terminal domain phosphatase n=1 Tax=Staphylotrichum tortipilum TaxID=2831512 RepID=A0AAN6MEA1_9PEZI|nr:hypothetical protein C8A05DRAFT_18781 [Staphylotrichum longicolle]
MTKVVRLGARLRYPVTVVKLLKRHGDKIKKQEALLEYSFKWMREVGDSIGGETWQEEQTTIATWESPADGELTRWLITEGQHIVSDRGAMEVKEECSHEIQFQGLCGMCGKDMTEVNWATETRDTARAPISMVHDQTNLTVSAVQAQRTEQELQRRLLQSRKLSLVVDLDQTIIQACIDPTVGEWQKDPTNPNHESVKNIKSFQLDDGPGDLARHCSYYIKTRPGLDDFLRRISDMYELHVYTMGTRAYAQHVARVVDPDKKLFGNRVISRDENGNIFAKNLQRLFPVSTHMVAIIDDRSDVWPRNRPNLIKVSPYEFFKGIGDINSSFLPKRQDLLTSGTPTNGVGAAAPAAKKESAAKNGGGKQDAVAEAGDDPTVTKRQVEEQERAFEKQINDRPLQLLQEKLDREDEEAEKATVLSEDGSESRSSSPPAQRHRALQDDDNELEFLEKHLTALHKTYYAEYDSNRAAHRAAGNVGLSSVPDAGRILDELKSNVLKGFKIVLSGVLPRGVDIYRSEIGLQILNFGAELGSVVGRDVTHLVVNTAQPGREKLLAARRRPRVKVVGQEWLASCFSQWTAVDETPFLFAGRLAEEGEAGNGLAVSDEEEGESDTENRAPAPNGRARDLTVKIITPSGRLRTLDSVDESEDDLEPGLLPDDLPDGQSSPIDGLKSFNWGSADQELEEFLASGSSGDEDNDEEDNEDDEDEDEELADAPSINGDGTTTIAPSAATRKRKSRDEDSDSDDEAPSAAEDADATPAKRLRRTSSQHGSSLRKQYTSDEPDTASGLPTPGRSEEQDGTATQENAKKQEGEDETMDFDAVAEMEAEFDAEWEAELDKAEAEFAAEEEAERLAMGEAGSKPEGGVEGGQGAGE